MQGRIVTALTGRRVEISSDGVEEYNAAGERFTYPLVRKVTITPREADVLNQLLRDGADNHTIARRLKIGYHTVKSHVQSLLHKTSTDNRTALVVEVVSRRIWVTVENDNESRHK